MLTKDLLAVSNNWVDLTFVEGRKFRDWMRQEKSILEYYIKSYHPFWMGWCWADLSRRFLIIPSDPTIHLFIEGIECMCQRWFIDIHMTVVILQFTCFHVSIVVSIGVGASFGWSFQDHPPLDRVSILIEAAERRDLPQKTCTYQ